MELIVIRGTLEEITQVMRQLGVTSASSSDAKQSAVMAVQAGTFGREAIDAFLRALTKEQRAGVVAIAKGANEREHLMQKLGLESTKKLQVTLAAIQRKARHILGDEARAIESNWTGATYVYELDGRIAEAING